MTPLLSMEFNFFCNSRNSCNDSSVYVTTGSSLAISSFFVQVKLVWKQVFLFWSRFFLVLDSVVELVELLVWFGSACFTGVFEADLFCSDGLITTLGVCNNLLGISIQVSFHIIHSMICCWLVFNNFTRTTTPFSHTSSIRSLSYNIFDDTSIRTSCPQKCRGQNRQVQFT